MQKELAIIALITVVAIAFAAWAIVAGRRRAQQRSAALREQFGPEYERALSQHGDRARAEQELLSRQKRLDDLEIRPLSDDEADRYSAAWLSVQQRFVDDPAGAVSEADLLIKDVMKTRGYPVGHFDQRVQDLSVAHANVIEHYRSARELARAREQGRAGTEELRQAMVHYRALFTDMLRVTTAAPVLREAHA